MYKKLPSKLKRDAPFCLWRKKKHKGKVRKIPYQVNILAVLNGRTFRPLKQWRRKQVNTMA